MTAKDALHIVRLARYWCDFYEMRNTYEDEDWRTAVSLNLGLSRPIDFSCSEKEVRTPLVLSGRTARLLHAFPEPPHTPRMGALGFYAPYLKEHGCVGLSYTAYGLIMQELEQVDSGLLLEASSNSVGRRYGWVLFP